MSKESVRKLFIDNNLEDSLIYSDEVSPTVEKAAKLLGCSEMEIAKTMAFKVDDKTVLVVMSGDAKIDNTKYRHYFHTKAKMLKTDEVEILTGHSPGGVCPFAVKDGVLVYLDVSLKRIKIAYAGGGDQQSTVKVTIKQLEELSNYQEWIDVCKIVE